MSKDQTAPFFPLIITQLVTWYAFSQSDCILQSPVNFGSILHLKDLDWWMMSHVSHYSKFYVKMSCIYAYVAVPIGLCVWLDHVDLDFSLI